MLVSYGSIGFFFVAALAICMPIKKRYYFAPIAAYIASSLLCLAMPYDIMSVMGFIFYFGPITIVGIIKENIYLFGKNSPPVAFILKP